MNLICCMIFFSCLFVFTVATALNKRGLHGRLVFTDVYYPL